MWDWVFLAIPYFALLWVMVENKQKHAKAIVRVWENLFDRAKAYFILLWGMVKKEKQDFKKILIAVALALLSVGITYVLDWVFVIGSSGNSKLGIFDTKLALFFAVFASFMTIWSRMISSKQVEHTEKQIKFTEKQIKFTEKQIKFTGEQVELTRKANNNETFIKAVELLHDSGKAISILGGLQTIIDLAKDDPKFEYIRCKEFVCNWLRHNYSADKDETIPPDITSLIKDFLGTQFKGSEKYVSDHMKKQGYDSRWPDIGGINFSGLDFLSIFLQDASLVKANLQGTRLFNANLQKADLCDANLQKAWLYGANLQEAWLYDANLQGAWLKNANLQGAWLKNANLQGADLDEANLKDAEITLANMKDAKDLTKEQILSAKWLRGYRNDKPPELPDELSKDPDIQTWLKKPYDKKPHDE